MTEISVSRGRLWGEAIGLAVLFLIALAVSGIAGGVFAGFYLAAHGQTFDPNDLSLVSKISFLCLPIATILTLIGAHLVLKYRGLKWADVGLKKPPSLIRALVIGVGIVISALIVSALVNIGMSNLGFEQDLSIFEFLPGDTLMYIYMITFISWISAGFTEEFVFRGIIMSNLAKAMGETRSAWLAAALIQAVIFGLFHSYQGLNGVVATAAIALVFGLFYFKLRNLWPIILAHALVDVFGFTVVYYQIDVPL